MRRKSELPELLAPAGSFEALVAAVEAGADAVYVGGKRFGARAYAKNFDAEELSRALSYCRLNGVRLYVTVNTLLSDREIDDALAYAAELYSIGVDALIVADLGLLSEIHRRLPDFELHASTQASVHDTRGAEETYRLGCVRCVPARELSREDIKSLVDNSSAEIEVFLHGALCVSYSGQCLFSSLVGGRSGNRGECAQPCRLPYNGKYPLSLTDLSLAEHIPELIDLGVSSLKIEGRMKSPSYVYTVTRIYRRLLDEKRNARPEEIAELRRAFSRGGFTDGYFVGNKEKKMTGVRSEEDKSESRESELSGFEIKKHAVSCSAKIRLGEPSEMTLSDGERTVTVCGEIPAVAQNSPLTEASVKERLCKMGNTLLSLKAEDITLELDEGVNLPPSAINALRRLSAEAFENFSRPQKAMAPYKANGKRFEPLKTAEFFSSGVLSALSSKELSLFDITFVPLCSDDKELSLSKGVSIPPIVFDSEREEVLSRLENAKKCGVMYALVNNIGHISLAKEVGLIPFGGHRLNITNSASRSVYELLGIQRSVLSPELTLPQARDVGGSLTVLGRIPLMLTERCFIKENFGCQRCGSAAFTDRKGERFPIMRESGHRNVIFNSALTYMGDRKGELSSFFINGEHFLFTTETPADVKRLCAAYRKEAALPERIRRIGRR